MMAALQQRLGRPLSAGGESSSITADDLTEVRGHLRTEEEWTVVGDSVRAKAAERKIRGR